MLPITQPQKNSKKKKKKKSFDENRRNQHQQHIPYNLTRVGKTAPIEADFGERHGPNFHFNDKSPFPFPQTNRRLLVCETKKVLSFSSLRSDLLT